MNRHIILVMKGSHWVLETCLDDRPSAVDTAYERTASDSRMRAVAVITRTIERKIHEQEYHHD
jgi:hypothetical protein